MSNELGHGPNSGLTHPDPITIFGHKDCSMVFDDCYDPTFESKLLMTRSSNHVIVEDPDCVLVFSFVQSTFILLYLVVIFHV